MKVILERVVDAFSEDRDSIVREAMALMKPIEDLCTFVILFQKVLDKAMGVKIAIPAIRDEDIGQVGAKYGYAKVVVKSTHIRHRITDLHSLHFTLSNSNQGKPVVTGTFSIQKVETEKLSEHGTGNEYAQTIEIRTKSKEEYSVTMTESYMLGIKGGGDIYIKIAEL